MHAIRTRLHNAAADKHAALDVVVFVASLLFISLVDITKYPATAAIITYGFLLVLALGAVLNLIFAKHHEDA